MVFFITVCVTSFFFSKQGGLLTGSLSKFAGAVNGVIIAATDFGYMMVSSKLMAKENHKLTADYNASFIKKVFIFKFINANLAVIFTIYNDRNLAQLN